MSKTELGTITREREKPSQDAHRHRAGDEVLAAPGAGLSLDRFTSDQLSRYEHAQAQRLRYMDGVFSTAPRETAWVNVTDSVPADKLVFSQDAVRSDIVHTRLHDPGSLKEITVAPLHFHGPNGVEEVFLVCDGNHSLVSRILRGDNGSAALQIPVTRQCLHEMADYAGDKVVQDLLSGLTGRAGALPRIVESLAV